MKSVIYPLAKVNLGLNIVGRRTDGYHLLETVFYPIPLVDVLEIEEKPHLATDVSLSVVGEPLDCPPEDNLVVKAYRLLASKYNLPPVSITLTKNIPSQAGLGGGSSDAAFTMLLLNSMFHLEIPSYVLIQLAMQLGADCPFFVHALPAFGEGIGERLTYIDLYFKMYKWLIVKPPIAISTREAFSHITVRKPTVKCVDIVRQPIENWRGLLVNDFEESIFPKYPSIRYIKETLYENGALYAAMSGSGSSVFGIFEQIPATLVSKFSDCRCIII